MNKKENFVYPIIIIICFLALMLMTWFSNNKIAEKNREINNLQAEILSLKEENRDVMNLNVELMEEIEELKNNEN